MAIMTTVKRGSITVNEGYAKDDGRMAFEVVVKEGYDGELSIHVEEYVTKGMKKVHKRVKKMLRKGDNFIVRITSVFWNGETFSDDLECTV